MIFFRYIYTFNIPGWFPMLSTTSMILTGNLWINWSGKLCWTHKIFCVKSKSGCDYDSSCFIWNVYHDIIVDCGDAMLDVIILVKIHYYTISISVSCTYDHTNWSIKLGQKSTLPLEPQHQLNMYLNTLLIQIFLKAVAQRVLCLSLACKAIATVFMIQNIW